MMRDPPRAATVSDGDRPRIVQRGRSAGGGLDWALAVLLASVGTADLLASRFAEPLWAGVVATLLVFLPLGLRRRHPVEVLAVVGAASLLLELGLGNPRDAQQYSFEVFVAWL